MVWYGFQSSLRLITVYFLGFTHWFAEDLEVILVKKGLQKRSFRAEKSLQKAEVRKATVRGLFRIYT